MELSRNISNSDLLKNREVMNLINQGKLVIIDKGEPRIDSDEKTRVSLFLVGKYYGESNSGTLSKMEAKALGFNSGRTIIRHVQSFLEEFADQVNIGDTVDQIEEFAEFKLAIQERHSFTQEWETKTPIANSNGELLVESQSGKETYAYTDMVELEELNHKQFRLIPQSQFTEARAKAEAKSVEMQA